MKESITTPLQAARHMYGQMKDKGYTSPLSLRRSYEKRDNRAYRAQIAGISKGRWETGNGKAPTDAITVTRVGEIELYRTFSLEDLEREAQSGYEQSELELPLDLHLRGGDQQ